MTPRRSWLDRPVARVAALAVAAASLAVVAYVHRDDIRRMAGGEVGVADDPVARCVAERTADIERLRQEGTVDAARAALFRQRAEAMCQAMAGGAGPPGAPPVVPPRR